MDNTETKHRHLPWLLMVVVFLLIGGVLVMMLKGPKLSVEDSVVTQIPTVEDAGELDEPGSGYTAEEKIERMKARSAAEEEVQYELDPKTGEFTDKVIEKVELTIDEKLSRMNQRAAAEEQDLDEEEF